MLIFCLTYCFTQTFIDRITLLLKIVFPTKLSISIKLKHNLAAYVLSCKNGQSNAVLNNPTFGTTTRLRHSILFYFLFYPTTLECRRGTTDESATIPFHLDLFSADLVELAKSIPVHPLILSSHVFFCLPLFLFSFTVPCRIVFAKPEDLESWPNHLSFRFLTRAWSSPYSPMAAWIFLRTSLLVTWFLYEIFNSLR